MDDYSSWFTNGWGGSWNDGFIDISGNGWDDGWGDDWSDDWSDGEGNGFSSTIKDFRQL